MPSGADDSRVLLTVVVGAGRAVDALKYDRSRAAVAVRTECQGTSDEPRPGRVAQIAGDLV